MRLAELRTVAVKGKSPAPASETSTPAGAPAKKGSWKDRAYYGALVFLGLSTLGSIGMILEGPEAQQARLMEQAKREQAWAIEQKKADAEAAIREREEAKHERLEACTDVEGMAYAYAKQSVTLTLKSPSSASFPWTPSLSTHTGDCKFTVLAYVDAQNGFGAMLRKGFLARLAYEPATEEWRLISLSMDP